MMSVFFSLIVVFCSFTINVNLAFSATSTSEESFDRMTIFVQRSIVQELSKKKDNASAARLMDIMKNGRYDAVVRSAAAIGLGKFPNAFNTLNDLRNTNYLDIRQGILISLFKLRPASIKTHDFVDVLDKGNNETRKLLLDCLPANPDIELLAGVLKMINDYPEADSVPEISGAQVLEIYEYRPIIDYLEKIGRKDAVISALTQALDKRSQHLDKLASIIRPYTQPDDPYAVINTTVLLPIISPNGERTIHPLTDPNISLDDKFQIRLDYVSQCHKDSNTDYFIPIVTALKEWPAEQSAECLGRFACSIKKEDETDDQLVFACIQSLASIGTKAGVNALDYIINYTSWEYFRIAAIEALGFIGGDDAVEVLKKQTDNNNENVKTAAEKALLRIKK